jgi:4-hydroxybenzoate polyprenyltransferase
VTRLAVLSWRMLRYRVAAMLWLFMLLGAAWSEGLHGLRADYAWAALALGWSYVAATAVNDVADRDVDRVNHPRDAGRPLVSGQASEGDLRRLHALAAVLALACAVPLGALGLGVVALSLAIGHAYSLPPLRLSYRTVLAPLVLAVAYVLVPFVLGVAAAGGRPSTGDASLAVALLALFVARIVLKDFRDRRGDALYDKPTLLLRHGTGATCAASGVALVTGAALLLVALRPTPALALLLQAFVVGIAWMLLALAQAPDERAEQVAIGLGARLGNGLLITVLAWLVLEAHGAPQTDRLLLAAALTALFVGSAAALAARPDDVVIGYKG